MRRLRAHMHPKRNTNNSANETHKMSEPASSNPIHANFASEKLTIGAGVAIFHLASARVVICYHSRDGYWFLPKGRRNVGEDTTEAGVREGFEEVRFFPSPFLCISAGLSSCHV